MSQEIIDMAEKAGLAFGFDEYPNIWQTYMDVGKKEIECFVELIRADALVRPCCGDFDKCQQICMPRATAKEREACAKVCEDLDLWSMDDPGSTAAKAIRARGQNDQA